MARKPLMYALLAVPMLLSRLLSDRPGTWTTAFHYNAILAPKLVLAAVDVLSKVTLRFPHRNTIPIIAAAVFAAGVASGIALVPAVNPLNSLFTGQAWTYSPHMAAQQRMVNMVPSGVCVEADDRLVPHLTNRTVVGIIGRQTAYATWAIIDFTQNDTGGGGDGNFTPIAGLAYEKSHGFQELSWDDNIVLLYRPGPAGDGCAAGNPLGKAAP